MLDLNVDTHRNKLLKYNSVLKAIKEQFLSKDITLNCWKNKYSLFWYATKSQNHEHSP